MGFGKYFYWVLWLPVMTVSLISIIFFYISRFLYICNDIAKGLLAEIKDF